MIDMKKKDVCIPETLSKVFRTITYDSNSIIENDKRFRIAEILVEGVIIGIGINPSCTLLKFYMIKKDCKYESYNPRKYKATFCVGLPETVPEGKPFWAVMLEDNVLTASTDDSAPNNFKSLEDHITAVGKIMKTINILSFAEVELPVEA